MFAEPIVLSQIVRVVVLLALLVLFAGLVVVIARSSRRSRVPGLVDEIPGRVGPDHMAETAEADLRTRAKLFYYAAWVTDVYDGDTMTVNIDLGLGVWRHDESVRLWKVNTPEVRGPEREEGLKVRNFVRSLVLERQVLLRTILDKRGQDRTGKFGRLLGEVLVEAPNGSMINVNQALIQQGMAVPVDAGGSLIRSRGIGSSPESIPCPYCGQTRDVDPQTKQLEPCPNCLDPAFSL